MYDILTEKIWLLTKKMMYYLSKVMVEYIFFYCDKLNNRYKMNCNTL